MTPPRAFTKKKARFASVLHPNPHRKYPRQFLRGGKNSRQGWVAPKNRVFFCGHCRMPPECPPRWFWGNKGGCFVDFYAQNLIFGHIGVSKLIISGLLALPSYRVITHQNCSLPRPNPPSVLRVKQNPSRKVIFVNQSLPKSI